MNKARKLRLMLSSLVLCFGAIACSGGDDKLTPRSGKSMDVLATVRALEMKTTFDPASVATALDANLSVDAEHSDNSFTYYVGAVRADAPAAALIDTVEVRMPVEGNATAGSMVYLTFKQGGGPTMDDVVDRFGPATSVDAPPANPQTALVLSYETPRSRLRFGIGPSATHPVVSATIDRTG